MTIETVMMTAIAGYFIWRLYRAFHQKPTMPLNRISLIIQNDGTSVPVIRQIRQTTDEWNEEFFLMAAKIAFQKVMTAFVNGNVKALKEHLSDDVWQVFKKDIETRQQNNQKMDFSLICFDSADIIHQSQTHDEVTVRFMTEQINLLKDATGRILEGDALKIAKMTDTWVFKKQAKQSWLVTATQSRMTPCVK